MTLVRIRMRSASGEGPPLDGTATTAGSTSTLSLEKGIDHYVVINGIVHSSRETHRFLTSQLPRTSVTLILSARS